MSSLSVILLNSSHGEVQYNGDKNDYPRLYPEGSSSEIDICDIVGETFIYLYNDRISEDTQYFYQDSKGTLEPVSFQGKNKVFDFDENTIVSVGNLLVLENTINLKGILHWYKTTVDGEPAQNLNGITEFYFNIINSVLTIRSISGGAQTDYQLLALDDECDNTKPEYQNSIYNAISSTLRNLIDELSELASGTEDDIIVQSLEKYKAKESTFPDNVNDKTELIERNTAPDYICFNTLLLNSGIRTTGEAIGDPLFLYLDQETSARQFVYVNSLGEQTPVQFQNMVERLVTETTKAVKLGDYIQLIIYFNADSSTVDYEDSTGLITTCQFDGEDIFWGVRGHTGTDIIMIKVEEAVYQSKHFYIDVSEERLILYPKDDYAEYCIQSATLTNVL